MLFYNKRAHSSTDQTPSPRCSLQNVTNMTDKREPIICGSPPRHPRLTLWTALHVGKMKMPFRIQPSERDRHQRDQSHRNPNEDPGCNKRGGNERPKVPKYRSTAWNDSAHVLYKTGCRVPLVACPPVFTLQGYDGRSARTGQTGNRGSYWQEPGAGSVKPAVLVSALCFMRPAQSANEGSLP